MGAPDRLTRRIERRRDTYLESGESVLVVTIANPHRSNLAGVGAFLVGLILMRQYTSVGLLLSTVVGLGSALLGVLLAALAVSLRGHGSARAIPARTAYLVLTDRRLVVVHCRPWGTPGPVATSYARDQIAAFGHSTALLTSRLRLEFVDGSVFVGDVHGTLGSDVAATGNAWISGPATG